MTKRGIQRKRVAFADVQLVRRRSTDDDAAGAECPCGGHAALELIIVIGIKQVVLAVVLIVHTGNVALAVVYAALRSIQNNGACVELNAGKSGALHMQDNVVLLGERLRFKG